VSYPVELTVEIQDKIVQLVAQEGQPRCYATDAVEQVAVCDQVSLAIRTYMFALVDYLHTAKAHTVGYHGTQEFIVITGHIDHSGITLGMTQDSAYHIGMTLFPTPFVLFDLPSIYDVTHQIQGIAGVVLEEVVELFGLAISGAQVYITDKD
jgi:hypothetical protein